MPLPTSITTRLEYQHQCLFDIIEGLSDEQIRRQVVAGKWSIFENIVHLATYQHRFIERVQLIMDQHNPEIPRYTAESDPLFHDHCAKTTREVMQDLITTRREMVTRITALKEDQLPRLGVHPVFGDMNVVQWLNFFLLHEAHHLFTIFKLVPALPKEAGNKFSG